jgi:hypothetical protein
LPNTYNMAQAEENSIKTYHNQGSSSIKWCVLEMHNKQ